VIVLGLILVVLSVGAGVILFLATDSIVDKQQLEFAGYSWAMTPLAMLITGAAVLLLLWLGLALIRGSVKRRRRPAREAKEAERQAKIEESIRADERARAEETHQSALAERDRVRDQEFEARMAERDREREGEFATRQQDAEERARAYERERLEQEYAARPSTAGGSATAAAVGAGAGAAAASHGDHGDDEQHDHQATGDDFTARHSADAPVDSAGATTDADDSTRVMAADGSATHAAGTGDTASDDPNHPGYRTVADKIMGRDPAGSTDAGSADTDTDTDRVDGTDSADRVDATDSADRVDATDSADRVDGTDSADRVDGTDSADRVDATDTTGRVETADDTYRAERATRE
jgi:hypothetical protein